MLPHLSGICFICYLEIFQSNAGPKTGYPFLLFRTLGFSPLFLDSVSSNIQPVYASLNEIFISSSCVVSTYKMASEFERIWKEAVLIKFKIPYRRLP